MKAKIDANAQPWKASWDILVANSHSSPTRAFTSPVPATIYRGFDGTSIAVVVDIVELNSVTASGSITIKLTKDSLVNLSLNTELTTLGGRNVQNSVWTLDDSDQNFYVFTTNTAISSGNKLSIGLTGQMTPGNTKGVISLSVAGWG